MPDADEITRRAKWIEGRILKDGPATRDEYDTLRVIAERQDYGGGILGKVLSDRGLVQESEGAAFPAYAFLFSEERVGARDLELPELNLSSGSLAHPSFISAFRYWPWRQIVGTVGAQWVRDEYERLQACSRIDCIQERDNAERGLREVWEDRLRPAFEKIRGLLNVIANELRRAFEEAFGGAPGSEPLVDFHVVIRTVWHYITQGKSGRDVLRYLAHEAAYAIALIAARSEGEGSPEELTRLMRAQVRGLRKWIRHRDEALRVRQTAEAAIHWLLTQDRLAGRSTVDGDWLQPVLDGDDPAPQNALAARPKGPRALDDLAALPTEAWTDAEKSDGTRLMNILSTPALRYKRAHLVYRSSGQESWKEAHADYQAECKEAGLSDPPHDNEDQLKGAFHQWVARNNPTWIKSESSSDGSSSDGPSER